MHIELPRTFMSRAMAAAILLGGALISNSLQAAVDFESDFESATAMTEDGWIAAINVFSADCSTYQYTYDFAAPDNGPQVSALVAGATSQVVNIYSNYDDGAHATGCLETNVFQQINPITEADVGEYEFSYDVELPPAEFTGDKVNGFVKVFAPGFSSVLLSEAEPSTAGSKTITVTITPDMVGGILQFGFNNLAANYEPSGMYYDNASFSEVTETEPPTPPAEPMIDFQSDFESATAMTEDGWIAVINYFTPDCSAYVSTAYDFPAPDNGPQVSALTDGDNSQVVNIYSNYDDGAHATHCLETNVFQEIFPITEAHVGDYVFSYDVELPPAEFTGDKVNGFVKVLTSDYSAVLLNLSKPSMAGNQSFAVSITEDMVGGRLQFGFNNYAHDYEPSGMYYDNVAFYPFFEGIPTLENWGMLLLIMLLGGVGAIALSRRF